jgi:prolyl-tRNA synthetase
VKKTLSKAGISSKIFPATSSLGERRRKIKAMGIPFTVEIGPNEIKRSEVQIKQRIPLTVISTKVMQLPSALRIQSRSLEKVIKSRAFKQFKSLNRIAKSKKDLLDFTKNEFLTKATFCDEPTCYKKASKITGKEIIGRAYEESLRDKSKCIICGKKAIQNLYFGVKWKGEK